MTISVAAGAFPASASLLPGVVYASNGYTPGWAFNATGKDDTAALNAALNAARAISNLGNGVGKLVLDAAVYYISGPLNLSNVTVVGQGPAATRINIVSDWCSALPCNAGSALDQQPSVPLGAPTQTNPAQGSGSSAYTLNQVVSIWVTAANSRNGGETPVSGLKQITVSGAGNAITANWTAISGADSATTYNIYMDRSGGTSSASAVKVASLRTGTSWQDTTGTGGSGHPPTVDTTGGVGITPPDYGRKGTDPNYQVTLEGVWVNGPGGSTLGVVPAHVSAIRQGHSTVIRNVRTGGVFAGIYQNLDHEKVYDSNSGGYYSIYYGGPHGTGGDQVYEDLELSATWACFGIAAETAYGGARFTKIHTNTSPFGFYKESVPVSGSYFNVMFSGCLLDDVAFESIGNGNIFSAGTDQSPQIGGNTFNGVESVNAFDPGITISTATQDWQGVAIGRMNAPIDTNNGWWAGNSIVGSDPAVVKAGVTVTCGMAVRMLQGGEYFASGLIDQLRISGKPFTSGASNGADFVVRWYGCICRGFRASGAIAAGDLVMAASGGQPTVAKSTGASKPIGVAVVAAADTQAVLVAMSGALAVNSSGNTIAAGATVIADGTNNGAVASSGSPTLANYVGVAQQANSGGLTQVLLQGLG